MLRKILFNIVVGLVLIFIWSRFVNLGQIVETISHVSLIKLIPVLLFMFLSPTLRAIRLKIFLSEVKRVPLQDLIYLNGAAQMLNFFIPIRLGEIAKGVYLNTRYDLKLGKAVIWIFIDRFVDFLAVLTMTTLLLFLIPTSLNGNFIMIISGVLLLALCLTYLAIFQPTFSRKIIDFLQSLLIEKHIKRYFDTFSTFILDSFTILDRHWKDLLLMIVVTVLAYGADAAIWYFTFIALGNGQSFLKMYLGQLLSALTYLIPAAPGYIGSAEASGLLILSGIFKINANLSSAMIVLFHIVTLVFMLIFGLISIFLLKLDVGEIFKKALRKQN